MQCIEFRSTFINVIIIERSLCALSKNASAARCGSHLAFGGGLPIGLLGLPGYLRELYLEYGGDKERACAAYVLVEQIGEVERKSNK